MTLEQGQDAGLLDRDLSLPPTTSAGRQLLKANNTHHAYCPLEAGQPLSGPGNYPSKQGRLILFMWKWHAKTPSTTVPAVLKMPADRSAVCTSCSAPLWPMKLQPAMQLMRLHAWVHAYYLPTRLPTAGLSQNASCRPSAKHKHLCCWQWWPQHNLHGLHHPNKTASTCVLNTVRGRSCTCSPHVWALRDFPAP